MRVKARFLVPAIYLTFAAYAWVEFVRTNGDGLANIGLYVVTLPVALLGLALTEVTGADSFVLQPRGFGYYGDHALYYGPGVIVTASLLYWVTAALSRTRE